MGEFGATIMVAGNWPGKTQTMPMAIYSKSNEPGGYGSALWMVLFFVAVAGVVMYVSIRMGKRAVKE